MRVAVKLKLVAAMKPESAAAVHPALVCALKKLPRERGAQAVLGGSPAGAMRAGRYRIARKLG